MYVLEILNVSKFFKKKEVLKGITLKIEKGEIFGLVGKNASGKTTLINLLSGLIKKDRGKILFFGEPPVYPHIFERIAVFRENPSFYPHLTLKDNLDFFSKIYGISKYESLPFDEMGLLPHLYKKVNKLSKGTLQKIGLILCLWKDVEIYILDEPTAHLDPETKNFVRKRIYELSERGKTIFLTTHVKEDITFCKRVSILKKGAIEFTGSPYSEEVEAFFNEDTCQV